MFYFFPERKSDYDYDCNHDLLDGEVTFYVFIICVPKYDGKNPTKRHCKWKTMQPRQQFWVLPRVDRQRMLCYKNTWKLGFIKRKKNMKKAF
jgi:hypothetical protein